MIPIARPTLGEAEVQRVAETLRSGWVTQGPQVQAFESAFAQQVGAPHACAVSNCTAALHVALTALGIGPGDEVITVSHSFVATANAIRYCGATPVFVDIDPATYNMDPAHIEACIGSRTRAILCVHQIGMPCSMEAILKLAERHQLPVVEDAACAIGSEILMDGDRQAIGRPHGRIACFSFHPRKVLTTGDGGMLTTTDPELDRQFRLLRQHGMSVSDSVRHTSNQVIFERYDQLGFNYRMTDIQAAVGVEQLKRLPEIIARRRQLAEVYHQRLAAISGLMPPHEPAWARSNWQSYAVRLPSWCDQRAIMQAMLDEGISTRRGIMCIHREKSYPPDVWRSKRGVCDDMQKGCIDLRESEQAQDRTLLLPLFHEMRDEQQARVVQTLAQAVEAARPLERRP
ncbi:MAG: DegT/DnrJ/EryC1/StrS family aminotransferase [Magnetococcales bacterium]|nr:DegT/DnrJ/EryC1/StrS family aminotransferase [Magnetococcales bacterium]